MSFSQSFSLGENTLNQLDVYAGNIGKNINKNSKSYISPTKKIPPKQPVVVCLPTSCDFVNSSPNSDVIRSNKIPDVVDESPTEKSNILGKSIREQLKNASTSKKTNRKYMRRSRSDPITTNSDSKISASALYRKHGFTEDFASMFENTMDLDEMDNDRANRKTKIKLHAKFEEDDFDKYMQNIQTPSLNNDCNDTKNSDSLIALSDSGGSTQHVNVSEIERLMQTENFETAKSSPVPLASDDEIEWEDSAFFNDLLESQRNSTNKCLEQNKIEDEADPVIDVECISMQSGRNNYEKAEEDELESCFLENSIHLSNLNSIEIKSMNKTGYTQLDTSIFSQNISERIVSNEIIAKTESADNLSLAQPNKFSIDNLSEWSCSAPIIKSYKKKGIHDMFEWQAECLNNPKIKYGNYNLLYSAPTSAGKTFVSEVLMFQTVLKRQKKVIVILPFISVVREKMYSLQDLLRSSGIRVEGFFGGYTAPGGFESADIAICTIEKANAIVNRLLEQGNIDSIGMIVVDEVHLISDPNRGYILELLLTKVLFCSRKLNTNIRLVAMSATISNSTALLQNWLNAEFYLTNYRPIELHEMIKIGNSIFNNTMNLVRMVSNEEYSMIENDPDHIAQLCIETIVNGAAVIIFCPSKDGCENLALHVAQNIYKLGKSQTNIGERIRKAINMPLIEEVKGHLRNSSAGLDSILEKTISYGVSFHHAGLTFDERDIIESSFCKSSIRVIVATSTLSSGVNLPARRVIIRSPMFGGKPMCSLTYKQMCGRAGRMGKDTEGESILICTNNNAKVGQELIGAALKPITSCLSTDNHTHLKRALLEIIASGVATTRTELEEFVKCTLYHSEHRFEIKYFEVILDEYKAKIKSKKKTDFSNDSLVYTNVNDTDFVGKCMRFLERYEFIQLQFDDKIQELKFIPTRLGYACLASSMPPSDGFFLFSELQKARQNFVLETELHAIYLVTPFSVCYQLQDIDWLFYLDMWEKLSTAMQRVGHLVGVKESFLVRAMRGSKGVDHSTLQIHKRFYTAVVLHDLINECPLNEVAVKYKLNRGTLQSLQQTTSTFAGIVKSFCKALNWDMLALIIAQFQDRIFFGVHQDLIELMKISVLNGQRARTLYKAGYETLVGISQANVLDIEKCLTDSIGFDVQKRNGETTYDAEQRNKQRLLFVTGRADLSVKEAAKMIIDEAREYLCNEMGIKNINWSQSVENEVKRPSVASAETVEIDMACYRSQKRRISLDAEVATPTKRRNHGQIIEAEVNSMDESSENSDVDSIMLDSSISFYNDENDDFMEQLRLEGNKPNLANEKQNLAHGAPCLQIIEVTKTADDFNQFLELFKCVTEYGFSLAIARSVTSTESKNYRCPISPELYIYDEDVVAFHEKIKFIRYILAKKELTLICNDARTQLKTLLIAVAEIHRIDCHIKDPQVAQWLIHPEDLVSRKFSQMIKLYAPKCINLLYKIDNGNQSVTTTTKIRSSIKACVTIHIVREQSNILKKMGDGSIFTAFEDVEMPIQKSLLHMEQTGMSIDQNALNILSDEISEYVGDLEAEIFRLNGKRFAINSSRQVAQALKIRKKNGSIAAKCTRAQLLPCTNPMAKLILEHRSLYAILSKSIQPLIRKSNDNNRIYGSSYSFTQTGRISMYEPNLQNVAKDFHTEFIPRVFSCRNAFIVKPKRKLISADFCQLELRVLAHLSEDNGLISIFNTIDDVFISIAAKWNKVPESEVTEKMRNDTKQICYGIIYGMGTTSLSATMKCDEKEAQLLHESFHQTYPGIRKYIQKTLSLVRQKGFVETIAGRRRYISDINSNNLRKRAQAERQAVNTTIQGSAADIAKRAILRMERNLEKYQPVLKTDNDPNNSIDLVLHLHDELLYEVPCDKDNLVVKILKSSMENCANLLVPLRVKVKVGQSWANMKKIG
ncbi:DNA polymerase theta isoform X2 [Contarinia nasturtii]|uniref:DNA polymerase theta isoform X2 n=1 Tax=Contarinia nasturtii TaxID=265458 RepID=UPI0012D4B54D|nr:DNA polymerase theta isoform X2 [Contarinia nasturtii]